LKDKDRQEGFGSVLILTRKIRQAIWIGGPDGGTWVHVLAINRRGRVKLGVTAPDLVEVLRGELAGEDPVKDKLIAGELVQRTGLK
jgi:carbon storage regulator CsrA